MLVDAIVAAVDFDFARVHLGDCLVLLGCASVDLVAGRVVAYFVGAAVVGTHVVVVAVVGTGYVLDMPSVVVF